MTLEGFDEIGAPTRRYTPAFLTLTGTYGLSVTSLPYFIGMMGLKDLKDHLVIVEDLPTDLTTGWRLQELYQREIDWTRVDNEMVREYLRNSNKLKFFNAITVAILPRVKGGRLLPSFQPNNDDEADWPEAVPKSGFLRKRVGSVELYPHKNGKFSYIRWDTECAIAAVIDGQHRVASLRQYSSQPMQAVEHQTEIPVIFLVLDDRAGFDVAKVSKQEDAENALLGIVRELFIDLNRHAVEVSRARQILMNDRDLSSIGLRSLLAEKAGEYQPSSGRIPLGVIDWQSDNAKIEKGPFITTVVLLQICIDDMLALDKPKDPTIPEEIDAFVDSIESALDLDNYLVVDGKPPLPPLRKYVEKEYKIPQRPFSGLPTSYLPSAKKAFEAKWKPYLERLFLGFTPYKQVIEKVDAHGGLSGEWARVAALPFRAKQNYFTAKGNDENYNLITKPTEDVEKIKEGKWAFYAVFQKALMKCCAYLVRHEDLLRDSKIKNVVDARNALADEWVTFINELDAAGLLAKDYQTSDGKKLWGGIALNENSIKWGGAAANAITGLLLLWFYRRRDKRPTKTFWKAITDPNKVSDYPDMIGKSKKQGEISSTSWIGKLRAGLKTVLSGSTQEVDLLSRIFQLLELVVTQPLPAQQSLLQEADTPAIPLTVTDEEES